MASYCAPVLDDPALAVLHRVADEVAARLATIIDEMRTPELKELEFDSSTEAEKRKYALRQNSVHGFETTFVFEDGRRCAELHVVSSNGVPAGDIVGIGFRITAL